MIEEYDKIIVPVKYKLGQTITREDIICYSNMVIKDKADIVPYYLFFFRSLETAGDEKYILNCFQCVYESLGIDCYMAQVLTMTLTVIKQEGNEIEFYSANPAIIKRIENMIEKCDDSDEGVICKFHLIASLLIFYSGHIEGNESKAINLLSKVSGLRESAMRKEERIKNEYALL